MVTSDDQPDRAVSGRRIRANSSIVGASKSVAKGNLTRHRPLFSCLERGAGFEPATITLEGRDSAVELPPPAAAPKLFLPICGHRVDNFLERDDRGDSRDSRKPVYFRPGRSV